MSLSTLTVIHATTHHQDQAKRFWTQAQNEFFCVKQAIEEDADWAELVDQLDVMLRK